MTAFINPSPILRAAIRTTSSVSSKQPMRMCTFGASRVSRQVVVHTAKLANLQFSNDEIDRIVPDFDNMLQFVDSMYEFGIDSIEKSKSLLDELRVSGYFLRNDEPTAFPYIDDIMTQAPEMKDDLIVVPRITSD